MPIDRILWKSPLTPTHAPLWPCPICPRGTLQLKPDSFHREETIGPSGARLDQTRSKMDLEYAFSAWLECNACGEQISCCGNGRYEAFVTDDEDGQMVQDSRLEFSPRYFSRPMALFRVPYRCPTAVTREVRRSFAVFFCDLAAAANHVRQSVENILRHVGIERLNAVGNIVPLGARIEKFGGRGAENPERADALRLFDSDGDDLRSLTKDDLFDAYDMLESLLADAFVEHRGSIQNVVALAKTNRGPRRG